MNQLKLGFLTVHGNSESHSKMMTGVFDAAREYNATVIRFAAKVYDGEPERYNVELNHLYHIIEAQKLDGLMFLGWMSGLTDNFFEDFYNRFKSIPLLSVGKGYDEVPFVYADSKPCIEELVEHLITEHGYQRIVIVPPSISDSRITIYTEVMNKHGLYNPDYVIKNEEFQDVLFENRMKRLLEILIDERKMSFDAIIVMYDSYAQNLIKELNNRGYQIPKDIAVVCYEDTEYSKFSQPPLTTTTFPWREIGYQGCEKLIKMLRNEPFQQATPIRSKLIIRNSCGCNQKTILPNVIVKNTLVDYSDKIYNPDILLSITDELKKAFFYTNLDFSKLVSALAKDLESDTTVIFIREFESQIQKLLSVKSYIDNIDELEDFIYYLSKTVKRYITENSITVLTFEEIIQKAQTLIKEKATTALGFNQLQLKRIDQDLHRISQELVASFSIKELIITLERCLQNLNISNCYIYMFENHSLDTCRPILEYQNHKRIELNHDGSSSLFIADEIVLAHNCLISELLCVGDDFYGFIVFEPAFNDERIFHNLSIHISSALKCAILLENLREEIALRKEKEYQLINIVNYDALTGIFNRRYFYQALNNIIEKAVNKPEDNNSFYLLFIDIDGFKLVNDRYGHDMGDSLLIELSNRLKTYLGRYLYLIPESNNGPDCGIMKEAIFRLGGDEFTAVVSGISIEEMSDLAYRVTNLMNRPFILSDKEIVVTCSIGISIYPNHADTTDKILKCADHAMYRAKKQRNKFFFYEKPRHELYKDKK